jgi:hypothetical protein
MSSKSSLRLLLGLVLCGPLLPVSRAHAGETGGNAAACKPTVPAGAVDLVFNNDGVVNNGSTTRGVTCGAVRNTISSPVNLWVDFFDATATGSVFCQLTLWPFFGTNALWTTSQTSGTAAVGNTAFHFVIPSETIGFVELRCNLPPTSSTGGHSVMRGFNLQ